MLIKGAIPESSYTESNELKNVIFRDCEKIFGENTIFISFKKEKPSCLSKDSAPDGFVFDFKEKVWVIISIQPSNSSLFGLISTLNEFYIKIKNPLVQSEFERSLITEVKKNAALRTRLESKMSFPNFKSRLHRSLLAPPEIIIITDRIYKSSLEAWSGLKIEPAILKFSAVCERGSEKNKQYLFQPPCRKELNYTFGRRTQFANQKRLGKGDSLLQKEYELPILESLIELGGSAKCSDVLKKVQGKMTAKFSEMDLEKIASGSIRWSKKANWRKYVLTKKGYIENNSEIGIWKITEKGQEFYKIHTDTSMKEPVLSKP